MQQENDHIQLTSTIILKRLIGLNLQERLHGLKNVYLNFVGEINWWPDVFYEGIEFELF